MGMHVAPKSYLQVKTTQYEGCTDEFLTKRFNKKSIVAALVSNSAVLSAFKMAYVCVGKSNYQYNYSSYMTSIGVHEMHGQHGRVVHPN